MDTKKYETFQQLLDCDRIFNIPLLQKFREEIRGIEEPREAVRVCSNGSYLIWWAKRLDIEDKYLLAVNIACIKEIIHLLSEKHKLVLKDCEEMPVAEALVKVKLIMDSLVESYICLPIEDNDFAYLIPRIIGISKAIEQGWEIGLNLETSCYDNKKRGMEERLKDVCIRVLENPILDKIIFLTKDI